MKRRRLKFFVSGYLVSRPKVPIWSSFSFPHIRVAEPCTCWEVIVAWYMKHVFWWLVGGINKCVHGCRHEWTKIAFLLFLSWMEEVHLMRTKQLGSWHIGKAWGKGIQRVGSTCFKKKKGKEVWTINLLDRVASLWLRRWPLHLGMILI